MKIHAGTILRYFGKDGWVPPLLGCSHGKNFPESSFQLPPPQIPNSPGMSESQEWIWGEYSRGTGFGVDILQEQDLGWISHRNGIWGGYSTGIWGRHSKEKRDSHAKFCIMIVSIFQLDVGFWGRVRCLGEEQIPKSQNPRMGKAGRVHGGS